MQVTEDFLIRLETVMEEKGLTMSEVARMIHTQPSTITRWRQGSRPQRNSMIMLAQALGVSLEWLARGTGPRNAPGNPQKVTSYTEAEIEQSEGNNRLTEMSYGLTHRASSDPAPEMLGKLLGVMTVDELLDLASRLGHDSEALTCVLQAVRQRTGPPKPVTYIPTKSKKP